MLPLPSVCATYFPIFSCQVIIDGLANFHGAVSIRRENLLFFVQKELLNCASLLGEKAAYFCFFPIFPTFFFPPFRSALYYNSDLYQQCNSSSKVALLISRVCWCCFVLVLSDAVIQFAFTIRLGKTRNTCICKISVDIYQLAACSLTSSPPHCWKPLIHYSDV